MLSVEMAKEKIDAPTEPNDDEWAFLDNWTLHERNCTYKLEESLT